MNSLIGFDVGSWDYAAFVAVLLAFVAAVAVLLWVADLSSRISIRSSSWMNWRYPLSF